MTSRKSIIIAAACIMIIVIATVVYYFTRSDSFTPPSPGFFSKKCSGGGGEVYLTLSGVKVKTAKTSVDYARWSGDYLDIHVIYKGLCGFDFLEGNYVVNDSTIFLTIHEPPGPLASCSCPYDTYFRIDEIEKKDYKIYVNSRAQEKAYGEEAEYFLKR